jgi:tripartite-type tricarboxylate transporter receptor subunit TctC
MLRVSQQVSRKVRVAALPSVPTTAETGYPKIVGEGFYGVLVPTGTSPDIVARLHDVIVKVASDESARQSLQTLGFDIVASTPDEYTPYLRNEIERWSPIVEEAGIQVEQ